MSYDTSCYELAKAFLVDQGWNNEPDFERLAQEIQDTIEDFIADLDKPEEEHHEEDPDADR